MITILVSTQMGNSCSIMKTIRTTIIITKTIIIINMTITTLVL